MSGRWEKSTFSAVDLSLLVADGLVEEAAVRIPGYETVPVPAADERVCFQAYFNRGFALPLHAFIRGLLYSYRLLMHERLASRSSLVTPSGR